MENRVRVTGTHAQTARVGRWRECLRCPDAASLWTELQRLVVNHPLVRASYSAGLLVEEGDRGSAYLDLTQELFVTLLAKSRFQHYLDSEMTDSEIGCEISRIELTNLLTTELRKRYPESYRLARRISTIIRSSANFRRVDAADDEETPRRRLVAQLYGLAVWPVGKATRGNAEFEERVHMIPARQRDTRMVGCTGDAQIIISNSDLEDLIVSVLEACDSPVDVRTLRGIVMSRLPVMDIYLVPIGDGEDDDEGRAFEPVDGRENPEQGLLRREAEVRLRKKLVDQLMKRLSVRVRGKSTQYDRIISILWHCYLCVDRHTQLEVATMLGVSDTLVSIYRQRIEQELRALRIGGIAEARVFEVALIERVSRLMSLQLSGPGKPPIVGRVNVPKTPYQQSGSCVPAFRSGAVKERLSVPG